MTSLGDYLDERIAAGDFPSAVVYANGDQTLVARGNAVVEPETIPASSHTIYDLASLTKVLSTTLLLALEHEAGRVEFDQPVVSLVEELDRSDRRNITLRQLMTHTSGLPKWRPLYIEAGSSDRVPDVIASLPLDYEPGTRVVYSDPGFVLLGIALERLTGRRLDALFLERIAAPLGLRRTCFNPPGTIRREIAASEFGNEYERGMVGETAYDGWRNGLIWGEVHDANAYFLGGVAGHAGLFGTAEETAAIAAQFLRGGKLLRPNTIDLLTRNETPGLEEDRSMGFQLASTPDSSAGPALSPGAFGHNGFTGTSVWIDPLRGSVVVILTNRTHPVRRDIPMNEIRRRINMLAIEG